MKCNLCDSETPPLYEHHSLPAWICHTCKSLGGMIEGLVVDSQPPAPEIEAPVQESAPVAQTAQEPESEPAALDPKPEQTIAAQIEEPAPDPQVAQIVDQEPTVEPDPEADQNDVDTSKRKTKKLK